LTPDKHLGEVEMSTVIKDKVETDPEEEARLERIKKKPDVTECFNLMDFEVSPRLVRLRPRLWRDKS
jgi:L-lactate dehydrogenase (cytochrome)